MNPASHDSARDRQLEAILHSYLQAVDAGQAPDRNTFLRQHTEFASELAAFFANQEEVAQLAQRMAPPALTAPAGADIPTLVPGEVPTAGPGTHLRYFGDYELLAEIARGGMGIVYKARQSSLNRIVALKMILAGQLASAADVKRFRTEAEAAANLQHPNIVAIHEVGEHEGQHYFSMDYVEGQSLADLVREHPLPAPRAARYVQLIAQAIAYAHGKGTLHRDLKPSNVLIDATDQPRVTDFGLAKRIEGGAELTGTGQVLGTPSYMPPEQAAARRGVVGPASDVYSLGAVLYELVTGRPPFRAETPLDTLMQVLEAEPVSPRLLNPNVPKDLETICLKCLQKNSASRYGSAQELADDLGRFLDHAPIRARPIGRWRRTGHLVGKHPWTMTGLATLAIFVVGLVAYSFYAENQRAAWNENYLRARVARLALAQQTGRAGGSNGQLSPTAEESLSFLRKAHRIRPDRCLYEEALDVFLAERCGGERIYPRLGQAANLPPELADADRIWRPPFSLTRDARFLMFPGLLYEVPTGKIEKIDGPDAALADCDPTGQLLALRGGAGVAIKDRQTGKERFHIDPPPTLSFDRWRFSPDGSLLAVVSFGPDKFARTVDIWDANRARRDTTIELPSNTHAFFDFGPDSRSFLWNTLIDKKISTEVRIYSTQTGRLTACLAAPHGDPMRQAALSPDGTTLAWVNEAAGASGVKTVDLLRVADGVTIRRLVCPGPAFILGRVVFSPDGKYVYGESVRIDQKAMSARFAQYIYKGLKPSGAGLLAGRTLIWDAETGDFRLWLCGRGLGYGFGPNGAIAVARGAESDSELEIDLWRPAELIPALDAAGVRSWQESENSTSPDTQQTFGLDVVLMLWMLICSGMGVGWIAWVLGRGLRKKPMTARVISSGVLLVVVLLGSALYFGMELAERPDRLILNPWLLIIIFGTILNLAIAISQLCLRCYRQLAYGEELLRSSTPAELEAGKREGRRLVKQLYATWGRWCLGALVVLIAVACLDGTAQALYLKWGLVTTGIFFAGMAINATWPVELLYTTSWAVRNVVQRINEAGRPESTANAALRSFWAPLAESRLFWLLLLGIALIVVGVEVNNRLAGGHWPMPAAAASPEQGLLMPLARLGLGLFWVILSLARLYPALRGRKDRNPAGLKPEEARDKV
jgi:tRNA A-37 threonylcarbamoyl transferase component Bud32